MQRIPANVIEEAKGHRDIIQALIDGKELEFRKKGNTNWFPVFRPLWDFIHFEYRIKENWVRTGSKWKIDGQVYILARVDMHKVALNSLKDGNRWSKVLEANMRADKNYDLRISLDDFKKVTGRNFEEFELVEA